MTWRRKTREIKFVYGETIFLIRISSFEKSEQEITDKTKKLG